MKTGTVNLSEKIKRPQTRIIPDNNAIKTEEYNVFL